MIKYTVVFCDDIRQEVNGKHFLIGVYSGDLVPAHLPSTFPLSVYVKVQGLSGKHSFRIRMLSPGGEVAMDVQDEVEFVPESDSLPMSFLNGMMQIHGPGTITLEFTLDDAEPEIIGELKVQEPGNFPPSP